MNTHPEAGLSIEPEEMCKWRTADNEYGETVPGCEEMLLDSEQVDYFTFCPFCGERIEEVE